MTSEATSRSALTMTLFLLATIGAPSASAAGSEGCVDFDNEWPYISVDLDCLPSSQESSPPDAPWGLAAVPMVDGSATIVLTWQPPFSDGGLPVTGYNVYRSTEGGPSVQIGTVAETAFADSVPENDDELVELVSYHVTAVNADGESEPSSSARTVRFGSCVHFDDEPPFVWVDPDCIPPKAAPVILIG